MTDGKLKKRIKNIHEEPWKYGLSSESGDGTIDYTAGLLLQDVDKWLDEAKKDFPNCNFDSEWCSQDFRDTVDLCNEWFKKYFGDRT